MTKITRRRRGHRPHRGQPQPPPAVGMPLCGLSDADLAKLPPEIALLVILRDECSREMQRRGEL